MPATLWTIGHSNVPVEALLDALAKAGIEQLCDIRRYPMSRRNPQFNSEALALSLDLMGIAYTHSPDLGGRRSPAADSVNLGLRDPGFRGFADYEATSDFEAALESVLDSTNTKRIAIMCAESLPWRCHRSLIADTLVVRDHTVLHIYGGREHPHMLSPHARVGSDGRVTYPALL